MPTTIRPLGPGDAPHVGRIYFCAVYEGAREHYSFEQRRAWAGDTVDPDYWSQRLAGQLGFIAEQGGEPIGFMTINPAGYIDLAFVLPSAAGAGIGKQLYAAIEQKGRDLGASILTTEASKPAKPFFESQGWTVEAAQSIERRGVSLTNYRMQKRL